MCLCVPGAEKACAGPLALRKAHLYFVVCRYCPHRLFGFCPWRLGLYAIDVARIIMHFVRVVVRVSHELVTFVGILVVVFRLFVMDVRAEFRAVLEDFSASDALDISVDGAVSHCSPGSSALFCFLRASETVIADTDVHVRDRFRRFPSCEMVQWRAPTSDERWHEGPQPVPHSQGFLRIAMFRVPLSPSVGQPPRDPVRVPVGPGG